MKIHRYDNTFVIVKNGNPYHVLPSMKEYEELLAEYEEAPSNFKEESLLVIEQTLSEKNELIRAKRETLYRLTSDYLKADYDEALARGLNTSEELKDKWLKSKDEIRKNNPYFDGEK